MKIGLNLIMLEQKMGREDIIYNGFELVILKFIK